MIIDTPKAVKYDSLNLYDQNLEDLDSEISSKGDIPRSRLSVKASVVPDLDISNLRPDFGAPHPFRGSPVVQSF